MVVRHQGSWLVILFIGQWSPLRSSEVELLHFHRHPFGVSLEEGVEGTKGKVR